MARKHGPDQRKFGLGQRPHVQPDGSTGDDLFPGTSGENDFQDAIDDELDVQAVIDADDSLIRVPGPYISLALSDTDISTGGGTVIGFNTVQQNLGNFFTVSASPPYLGFIVPQAGLYIVSWTILTSPGDPFELWIAGQNPTVVSGNPNSRRSSVGSYVARTSGAGAIQLLGAGASAPAPLTGSAISFSGARIG